MRVSAKTLDYGGWVGAQGRRGVIIKIYQLWVQTVNKCNKSSKIIITTKNNLIPLPTRAGRNLWMPWIRLSCLRALPAIFLVFALTVTNVVENAVVDFTEYVVGVMFCSECAVVGRVLSVHQYGGTVSVFSGHCRTQLNKYCTPQHAKCASTRLLCWDIVCGCQKVTFGNSG